MTRTTIPQHEATPRVFHDRHGQSLTLDPAHRAGLQVDSDTGYGYSFTATDGDDDAVEHLRQVLHRVRLGVALLELYGGAIEQQRILNVGAGDGAEALCLYGLHAGAVVGTNAGDHFVGGPAPDGAEVGRRERARQRRLLEVFRHHAATLGLAARDVDRGVRLVSDDMGASGLAEASFDIVCSWATLEHLPDPTAALREMIRVLAPGGLAYHEYNSFFSLDGGHSPCTLDIPWGHVRLDAADFERCVRQFNPDGHASSMSFYQAGLNRMCLADLEDHARAAGFEVAALVPRARTEDLLRLTRCALDDATRNYPRVTVHDLVCRMVRVVLRKPR